MSRPESVRQPTGVGFLLRCGGEPPRPTFVRPPVMEPGQTVHEWTVSSGYRGGCRLHSGTVLAEGRSWHSRAGRLGEDIVVLIVATVGTPSTWTVVRSGRRVDGREVVVLDWDGADFRQHELPREVLA